MAQTIDFVSLLHKSQEYISENYAAALSDRSKIVQLRSYIEKYLHDSGFEVEGMTFRELADKLYSEMAEYSVLTKYLGRDEIEEININGWDDIAVTYTDGHIEKAKEHFYNPQHAVDVVKRLLHHSGMIIDNATPMSQGHLPGNTRITALKEPLVDDDRGISVSIRLLHPSRVDMKALVKGGNATQKMIDFLCMCLRYGISFVVAGATSSGKTTLLNALLSLCHCIHFALFSDVLVTDNSLDSSFHTGEVLVVILVQGICFCNGCIYLCVIGILVLQGSNGIFNSLRHCIHLCLLGFAFCSVNRVNGIFYRRIICIKAAIKSRCPCDGCIDSCVISGDVIVIPHKSWMTDSGNPFNARTGIGLQASKDICGGEVGDSSAAR